MKKTIFIFILVLALIQSAYALNLDIKETNEAIMIVELNRPAVFDLAIKNLGADDNVEFYNLVSLKMFPAGTTPIMSGETKEIKLEVSPIGEFNIFGRYTFPYYIRGQDGSEISQSATFKRISMQDAFELGAGSFDPQSNSIEIYLKNKENFDFGKVKAKFTSSFFNLEKEFELSPKEIETISLELNKEDFKQLVAGFYTMETEITSFGKKTNIKSTLDFQEKNIVTTTSKDYGLIVSTQTIQKRNDGNVVSSSETIIKKNIISRLFTSFSPAPDNVKREGFKVYYTWNKDINPGEVFELEVKTNYLFAFILILLVIAVVIIAKQYSKTNLVLKKRVTFVRAKGGEFALKVSILVNAKKFVEKVNIIDRLPPLVKLYEKFGVERPSRIDEKNKRIDWDFASLEPGETRVLSYIIYSKVGVLGRFALPSTRGIYESNGKIHETESNRAFFVTDQQVQKEE